MKQKNTIKIPSRGYYSISVLDKDGNEVKDKKLKSPTNNVITIAGADWSLFTGTSSNLFSNLFCEIGAGVSEITRDSSGLGQPSSGRSSGVSSSRSGNEVDNLDGTSTLTLTRVFSFGLGEKVGTFSEVGLYSASSGGTFVAGQLIKDEFGAPTTVTILSDEQLVVTYTLEWTIPNTSSLVGTGSVLDADNNSYSYEIWAQPYFTDYVLGGTSLKTRAIEYNTLAQLFNAARAADGTTSLMPPIDVKGGVLKSVNGNLVTFSTGTSTYSPSSFSANSIQFFLLKGPNSNAVSATGVNIVDTATALVASNANSQFFVVVKFLNPVTKTSNDTFSITAEVTWEI